MTIRLTTYNSVFIYKGSVNISSFCEIMILQFSRSIFPRASTYFIAFINHDSLFSFSFARKPQRINKLL